MAQAAKHIMTEHDLSAFIPSMSGMTAGIVINSNKGYLDQPRLISNLDQYISIYGEPNPANGTSEYAAINYLTYGGPLYILRVGHSTNGGKLSGVEPKYSCALVRTKVDPVPLTTEIPDPTYTGDPIVKPIGGMTKDEIDQYVFNLYKRNREYSYVDSTLESPVLNTDEIHVFGFEDLKVGDEISLTPVQYVAEKVLNGSRTIKLKDITWCNKDQYVQILQTNYKIVEVNTDEKSIEIEFPIDMDLDVDFPIYVIPFDLSANYEITELEDRVVNFDKITIDKPVFIDKGKELRLVTLTDIPYKFTPVGSVGGSPSLDGDSEDEESTDESVGAPEVRASSEPINISVSSKVLDTLLTLNSVEGIKVGHTIKIRDQRVLVTEVNPDLKQITVELEKGVTTLNAQNGDNVIWEKRNYTNLETPPYLVRSVQGSNQLIVTESDYIKNGCILTASQSEQSNSSEEFIVESKDIYKETQKFIHTNADLTCENTDFRIYRMDKSEFEERDGLLIYSANEGLWGDKIGIQILPSKINKAFYIKVFYDGIFTGEEFHVSRDRMKDGFGNQLEVEYVINGKSNYINVRNNLSNIDEDGKCPPCLENNYSVFRRLPDDVFLTVEHKNKFTKIVTQEDVLLDDKEIMVSDNLVFNLGDRIKFSGFPQEYKVKEQKVDVAGNKVIILDRKINFNYDGKVMIDSNTGEEFTKIPSGTEVLRFHHVKYYPISKLDKIYPGYHIPYGYITVAGDTGILLDGGVNNLLGGNNGSAVTTGDWMRAAELLFKERYNFQLVMDGGITQVAYQQKLVTLAEKRMTCFAYLSCALDSEKSANYLNSIIDYRNSTNLNTSWASLMTPHLVCYDQYNSMEVICSPDAFAAALQSQVARNSKIYDIAAGWSKGKIKALSLVREFNMDEMDVLCDNELNPIRYKDGAGIALWGNSTLQTMPSYLQMRHVRMLLIVIESGLKESMEYQTFQFNDESTRNRIVYMINKFLADTVSGGVYEFSVQDMTSDSDINNRTGVFRLIFSPKTSLEVIKTQLVITSKNLDVSLIEI